MFIFLTVTYWSSRSSMAKAFTVRTLPSASSATPVAFATFVNTMHQAHLIQLENNQLGFLCNRTSGLMMCLVILQAFEDCEWGGSATSPVLALCGTVCGETSPWERRRPLGREAQSPLSPWVWGRWCRGKQNIPPSVWHYAGPASMETWCYTA